MEAGLCGRMGGEMRNEYVSMWGLYLISNKLNLINIEADVSFKTLKMILIKLYGFKIKNKKRHKTSVWAFGVFGPGNIISGLDL